MLANPCLVLTPRMTPHEAVSLERAICLAYLRKVDVLEVYEAVVHSPSLEMQVPAVVRLTSKAMPHEMRDVKFSRPRVYQRDGHRCQYCGVKKRASELNYDHVIPRSKGGPTNWTNIVTSCLVCNGRKGGRTPKEAGMRLLRKPRAPESLPLVGLVALPSDVPELWLPYLEGHSSRVAMTA
jgi:5-methylcytosine-specific restriction endonuclease McrA